MMNLVGFAGLQKAKGSREMAAIGSRQRYSRKGILLQARVPARYRGSV